MKKRKTILKMALIRAISIVRQIGISLFYLNPRRVDIRIVSLVFNSLVIIAIVSFAITIGKATITTLLSQQYEKYGE